MKMHRSTQLFLYCSRGERSVKCIHPAFEMEASKTEQRNVLLLMTEGAGTREIHRRMSVHNVQHNAQLGISHDSMHAIIKDYLQIRKICEQWVLHQR